MTNSAVAVDLHQSLDVHRAITAKVTLYGVGIFDLVTKLCNLGFGQILCTGIRIDTGLCKDVVCALASDTVNIGQSNLNALVVRNINTSYTPGSVSDF